MFVFKIHEDEIIGIKKDSIHSASCIYEESLNELVKKNPQKARLIT